MIKCPRCGKNYSPILKHDRKRKNYIRETIYRLKFKQGYPVGQITKILGYHSRETVYRHIYKIEYALRNHVCYRCDKQLGQDSVCPSCHTQYNYK